MTPVTTALTFIRVIIDPKGDGERIRVTFDPDKVKSKVLG